MADSYAKKIQWKIEKMDPGSVFVRSDFAEIADGETLRRNLNRLTENGTLYRVQKGVYEKPKFNARLGEKVDDRSKRGSCTQSTGAFYAGSGGVVLHQRWAVSKL